MTTPNSTQTAQDAMMVDYISGTLPLPLEVMVASHMALNKNAEADFQALSAFGGDLLEQLSPSAMALPDMDALLDKMEAETLDDDEEDLHLRHDLKALSGFSRTHKADSIFVPAPLRSEIGSDLSSVAWTTVTRGVREYVLPISEKGLKASLLWIDAGRKIPPHTHKGHEYTLILDGSYDDELGTAVPGDFICNDGTVSHSPVAHAQTGCLCYVVQDAPLKFKGLLGLLINPFLKV